jgi:hypothetical protein
MYLPCNWAFNAAQSEGLIFIRRIRDDGTYFLKERNQKCLSLPLLAASSFSQFVVYCVIE